jgi:hypothetical protein
VKDLATLTLTLTLTVSPYQVGSAAHTLLNERPHATSGAAGSSGLGTPSKNTGAAVVGSGGGISLTGEDNTHSRLNFGLGSSQEYEIALNDDIAALQVLTHAPALMEMEEREACVLNFNTNSEYTSGVAMGEWGKNVAAVTMSDSCNVKCAQPLATLCPADLTQVRVVDASIRFISATFGQLSAGQRGMLMKRIGQACKKVAAAAENISKTQATKRKSLIKNMMTEQSKQQPEMVSLNFCETNVAALTLSICKNLGRQDVGGKNQRAFSLTGGQGDMWVEVCQQVLMGFLESGCASVRRTAAQSLGELAKKNGLQMAKKIVRALEGQLSTAMSPPTQSAALVDVSGEGGGSQKLASRKSGLVFAIACVRRALGNQIAIDSKLFWELGSDMEQPVRTWTLHSWSLLIETISAGNEFETYVKSTLSLVDAHMLADAGPGGSIPTHPSVLCALARTIGRVIEAIGPELDMASSKPRINHFICIWRVLKDIDSHELQMECMHMIEMLMLFAPQNTQRILPSVIVWLHGHTFCTYDPNGTLTWEFRCSNGLKGDDCIRDGAAVPLKFLAQSLLPCYNLQSRAASTLLRIYELKYAEKERNPESHAVEKMNEMASMCGYGVVEVVLLRLFNNAVSSLLWHRGPIWRGLALPREYASVAMCGASRVCYETQSFVFKILDLDSSGVANCGSNYRASGVSMTTQQEVEGAPDASREVQMNNSGKLVLWTLICRDVVIGGSSQVPFACVLRAFFFLTFLCPNMPFYCGLTCCTVCFYLSLVTCFGVALLSPPSLSPLSLPPPPPFSFSLSLLPLPLVSPTSFEIAPSGPVGGPGRA